jgi:hypothetical protein
MSQIGRVADAGAWPALNDEWLPIPTTQAVRHSVL